MVHFLIIFLIIAAGHIAHPVFMLKIPFDGLFEHEDWMKNVTSGDYQKYYEEMYHTEA